MAKKAVPPDDEPSEQQLTCIELLLAGKTKQGAAEGVGVAPYTVSRWLQDDAFVAALNCRRLEIHQENTERLRALAGAALDVLERALVSEDEAVQLKAAAAVLKAVRLTELHTPAPQVTPAMLRADRLLFAGLF